MSISFQNPYHFNTYRANPRQNSASFGVRIESHGYDKAYKSNPLHNGLSADEFIISRLMHYFTNSKGVKVLDVGSGQGRNAVPLAKLGYDVTALEINSLGQEQCREYAEKEKVAHKMRYSNKNILDDWEIEEKYDFAYMANVTEHLSKEQVLKALNNLNKNLKVDSILIFDATTLEDDRKVKSIWESKEAMQGEGRSYFKNKKEITDIAAQSGFELEEYFPYCENIDRRPSWVKSWKNDFDEYNWYVFKKTTNL